MTAAGPGLGTMLAPTARRVAAMIALGTARAVLRRRCRSGTDPASRRLAGAALAAAGPIAVCAWTAGAGPAQWRVPRSAVGRALLVAHVGSRAVSEELVWRAPLLAVERSWLRRLLAVVAGTSFVGAHLYKDGGRELSIHAVNTAGWTTATLCSKQVRWAALSHTVYNLVAVTLRRPPRTGR